MGNGIRQIALLWEAFFALSNLFLHPKQNHSNVGLPRLEHPITMSEHAQAASRGGSVARVAGTTEQYKDASEPFFSVLEQYQPDLLIVWGVRLWDNMPWEHWKDGVQMKVDDFEISNGFYELSNGKKVRAVCVYHPSSGYSWDYWYKVISQF